ncbi:MAG: protein-disulfide reductase DsbD domain-containing protein [Panacagrimonas sp.]
MRLLFRVVLAATLLGLTSGAHAGLLDKLGQDPGIPSAEEAFIVQPALWDGKELIVGWNIAPGCYLYRDKLVVESIAPKGYALGLASTPLAEAHRDEHFGEVAIFRTSVQLRFRPKSGTPPESLRVRYQGCAENKVCYPTQTRVIDVRQ